MLYFSNGRPLLLQGIYINLVIAPNVLLKTRPYIVNISSMIPLKMEGVILTPSLAHRFPMTVLSPMTRQMTILWQSNPGIKRDFFRRKNTIILSGRPGNPTTNFKILLTFYRTNKVSPCETTRRVEWKEGNLKTTGYEIIRKSGLIMLIVLISLQC